MAMEDDMLILTRRPGESIYIGDDIKIKVVSGGDEPEFEIEAPEALEIAKKERPDTKERKKKR